MSDVIGVIALAAASGGLTWAIMHAARRMATPPRPRKTTIGVDLAKPDNDLTALAPGSVTFLSASHMDDMRRLNELSAKMAAGPVAPTSAAEHMRQMKVMRDLMARMVDPPALAPMTATEVNARHQDWARKMQQQQAAIVQDALRGLGAPGGLGGLGMPGFGPSMAALGGPKPPGADDSMAGKPTEAPTAVIPNLLAEMSAAEVREFLDTAKVQRERAPADKRANYDAMIAAAEDSLQKIAARAFYVQHAIKVLGENMAAGLEARQDMGAFGMGAVHVDINSGLASHVPLGLIGIDDSGNLIVNEGET